MSPETPFGLWLTVIGFGIYHGLNPSMGWPLAVANGLSARSGRAVFATVLPLGAGHLLAMAVVLVPFALLAWYAERGREVRVGAGVAVLVFGVYKLIRRRHPRFLARIRPSQLTLWSFLMATTHGAGLMLVPIALSLCAQSPGLAAGAGSGSALARGHESVMALMASSVAVALLVALAHTLAMLGAGLALAWIVYRYLGLRFLRRGWFNLEAVWAASLIVTGGIGCALALVAPR